MATKDSLAPDDSDVISLPTDPPKKRRRARSAKSARVDDADMDDDAGDDDARASLPPRLVIAEPIALDNHHDDDSNDDDDDFVSEAPAPPKRARRRPRVEHVSTPPSPAQPDTSPEQPSARKKSASSSSSSRAKKRSSSSSSSSSAARFAANRFAHLPLELTGIVVFALGVLALLSLLSYSAVDSAAGRVGPVHNWIGPGGAVLADLLTLLVGVGAFLVPLALFAVAVACFRPLQQPKHALLRAVGGVGAALLHLAFRSSPALPFPAGGLLGALVADGASRFIAPLGTGIVAVASVFVGALIAVDRPLGPTTRGLADKLVQLAGAARDRLDVWREERRLLLEEEARMRAEIEADRGGDHGSDVGRDGAHDVDAAKDAAKDARTRRIHGEAEKRAKKRLLDAPITELPISLAPVGSSEPPLTSAPPSSGGPTLVTIAGDPPWAAGGFDEPSVDGKVLSLAKVLDARAASARVPLASVPDALDALEDAAADVDSVDHDDGALRIIERAPVDAKAVVAAAEAVLESPKEARSFHLPPLNLLDYDAPPNVPLDEAKMRTQADKLIAKFKDFGIDGRIREIRPGPVCTTYELVPAPGIKVSKIAALADDIAMAMEAIHVRIVAPIPGKGAVGIEIPNEKRETVYMKEIIADARFMAASSGKDKLMMALGKDIEGKSYYANLADMPHVLIAGTTGSGKSVSVNAMICSILYRATPEEVRFLMIDPKMLELSIYEGIPHLLLPPIIDSKKAARALKWAVGEMERRYQLMSELGVRDIAGYNELRPNEKLPFIVIVVDEYADLLAVAGKDVEGYIMRIAQKARAAGLHMMLATQRPSVDVITGVIKANFPVRMGFRLASNHDSKTIINRPGAEKLLGRGDMLFMPPGTSNVLRVHGAFISEKELHRVVGFLKAQGKPSYDMSILTADDDDEGEEGVALDEPKDARYDEALAVVARTKKCSTSWLQRMMNLGYQRAARIVDRMEREGMVGPAQNAKGDRDIFVKPEHLKNGDGPS